MDKATSAAEDNSNLFTVLERGDRRIMQIKKNCIILVGMTRAGKSTTFNWMRRLAMKGVENKYKTNTFFQVVVEGNADKAQLGSTMTSVTLAPNIYHLDDETTLIDMPGYEDRRNYIGVMGVSYFLNAVFEQAENVKFVLVFDELKFIDPSGDGIIKTFSGFVNMFNYSQLKGDIKKKFFSSLSAVVTRSDHPTKHYDMMRSISEQLKDDALISDNKESVVEVLDAIIPSNRVEPFHKARKDEPAPPCKFLDRFNEKLGWSYFPLKQSQQILKKALINIPFKRDYSLLVQSQKKELENVIEDRINSYTNFSHILKTAMNTFLNNWLRFIDSILHGQKLPNETIFDLSSLFQNEISRFLSVNDKYNSQELVERTIKVKYGTDLVGGIKAMFNIYNIANKVSDQLGSFVENMKAYADYFSEFADCLMPFCRNAEDEELLLRLQFVLRRGFREFSRFYAIDQEKIHKANQNMKDNCNLYIFQVGKKQYMESFIKPANIKLLRLLFRTLPEIEDFERLFNDYINDFQNDKQLQDELMYSEIHISIEFVKADILLAAGEKIKAGLAFISAFKSLCSQKSIIKSVAINENADDKELKRRFEAYFMRKLQFVDKVVGILRSLDIAVKPLAKRHALYVSQDIKDMQNSCEIFNELLKDSKQSQQQHIRILDDYVRYCMDWGRFDDANKLLQRKLCLERDSYDNYLEILKRIDNLQADKPKLEKEYKEKHLLSLKNEANKGQSLEQLFEDIKKYLLA